MFHERKHSKFNDGSQMVVATTNLLLSSGLSRIETRAHGRKHSRGYQNAVPHSEPIPAVVVKEERGIPLRASFIGS
jgi:hypothetical protein